MFLNFLGKVSYRHFEEGSWFIQEFCTNLTAFGRNEDVISLLTRTNKNVANVYFHEHGNKKVFKQMPMFISTLKKEFYLTRSYNRNFMLIQRKKIMEARKMLEEITNNLTKNSNNN